GNLFLTTDFSVQRFDPSGNVMTFADASKGISFADGLAFDSHGNLFVDNDGTNTVLRFDPSGAGTIFADASMGINVPVGMAFHPLSVPDPSALCLLGLGTLAMLGYRYTRRHPCTILVN